jgi:hypothetical protein
MRAHPAAQVAMAVGVDFDFRLGCQGLRPLRARYNTGSVGRKAGTTFREQNLTALV